MEFTDVYNLPCLGEEDLAAIPTYMQGLAERIEAALSTQQDALEGFLSFGSALWTTSVAPSIPPGPFFDLNFNTVAGGGGFVATSTPALPAGVQGWWHISSNVRLTPVGALTANSTRTLQLVASTLGADVPGTVNWADFRDTSVGALAGTNDALWASGIVYWTGIGPLFLQSRISHANVASNLTTTGTPYMYCVFLGDNSDVRMTL